MDLERIGRSLRRQRRVLRHLRRSGSQREAREGVRYEACYQWGRGYTSAPKDSQPIITWDQGPAAYARYRDTGEGVGTRGWTSFGACCPPPSRKHTGALASGNTGRRGPRPHSLLGYKSPAPETVSGPLSATAS